MLCWNPAVFRVLWGCGVGTGSVPQTSFQLISMHGGLSPPHSQYVSFTFFPPPSPLRIYSLWEDPGWFRCVLL